MLPRQLSFANVIALAALFIALGSGVWAAQQSPGPEPAPGGSGDPEPGPASGLERAEERAEKRAARRAAEIGLPKATGRVAPDGTLEAGARGMKASKVRRLREGTYCVSVRASVPIVTAGLSEEDEAEADVSVLDAEQAAASLGRSLRELECPHPHRWVVQTRNSRGVLDDSWFYVALFG